MPNFNWSIVTACCSIFTVIAAGFGLYVKLLLGNFEHDLFRELDLRYQSLPVGVQQHNDIDRRLVRLERRAGFWAPEAKTE